MEMMMRMINKKEKKGVTKPYMEDGETKERKKITMDIQGQ